VDAIVDGNAGPEAPRSYEAVASPGDGIYAGSRAGQAAAGGKDAVIAAALSPGCWRMPIERVFRLAAVAEAHALFQRRKLPGRSQIEDGCELLWREDCGRLCGAA
jgi:hypothetical protein